MFIPDSSEHIYNLQENFKSKNKYPVQNAKNWNKNVENVSNLPKDSFQTTIFENDSS